VEQIAAGAEIIYPTNGTFRPALFANLSTEDPKPWIRDLLVKLMGHRGNWFRLMCSVYFYETNSPAQRRDHCLLFPYII
jgi:hypothetical protein